MINVKLTRVQLLGLMKELPENHWMQIRLMEALMKNDAKVNHLELGDKEIDEPVQDVDTRLTAKDVSVHRGYAPEYYNKDYVKDETTRCNFDKSWVGRCNKPSIQGAKQCLEHYNVKCSMCDAISTNDCGETFQFVCGAALCENHKNKHDCVKRNRRF